MKEKVAVAMSGGVDSSLVATLLKEEGYEVIGITMRLSDEGRGFCLSPESDASMLSSVKDAKKVAEQIGIAHYVADFRDMFKTKVIDYFLDEYAAGRTPNPCVACNPQIKFGALFPEKFLLPPFSPSFAKYFFLYLKSESVDDCSSNLNIILPPRPPSPPSGPPFAIYFSL